MERFDYQLVLIAVVLGLALQQLLTCVAHILLSRHRTRPYWVHLVWLLTLFLIAVQYWHVMYTWRSIGDLGDTFFHYLLTLLFPVTLYVAATMIGPQVPASAPLFDFREYYYENHRGIFTACAVALLTMIVGNTVHLRVPWLHTVNLVRYGALLLLVALAWSGNRRLHGIAALALLLTLLAFVVLLTTG